MSSTVAIDSIPVTEREEWEAQGINPDALPKDPKFRKILLKFHRREAGTPIWILLTGLYPPCADVYHRDDRRARVRALVQSARWLLRRELKYHDDDPEKDERSIYWDPINEVCRYLQISRTKLSFFCKELSGLSISQEYDCIRVEQVPAKMRDALRAFLKSLREQGLERQGSGFRVQGSGEQTPVNTSDPRLPIPDPQPLDRWSIWKALRASRKWPDFSHGTWAAEYGFSSYTRLYRACMVVFRKTPHQLEMEIIDELLREQPDQPLPDRFSKPQKTLAEINAELDKLLTQDFLIAPWRNVPKVE